MKRVSPIALVLVLLLGGCFELALTGLVVSTSKKSELKPQDLSRDGNSVPGDQHAHCSRFEVCGGGNLCCALCGLPCPAAKQADVNGQ